MKIKHTYTKDRGESGLDLFDLAQIAEQADKLGVRKSWTRPKVKIVPDGGGLGRQLTGQIAQIEYTE